MTKTADTIHNTMNKTAHYGVPNATYKQTWPDTMAVHILGLTGAHGAGKDSCAAALVRHGYKALSFAQALRSELTAAFHIDERLLTTRLTKEVPTPSLCLARCLDEGFVTLCHAMGDDLSAPRSPRWLMQRWGTEYRRAVDADYWTTKTQRRIQRLVGYGWRNFVLTDVIFANEEDLLRRMGGKLVRVHRPSDTAQLSTETAQHTSLRAPLLPVDGDIVNDGTLAGLAHKTELAVVQVFGADALYRFGTVGVNHGA
jgi:hypothetical protein